MLNNLLSKVLGESNSTTPEYANEMLSRVIPFTSEITPQQTLKVQVTKLLGEGGYSYVYLCEDVKKPSVKYALKRMVVGEDTLRRQAENEIAVMRKISTHPHVVQFHAAVKRNLGDGKTEYLVLMDYCPTSLLSAVHRQQDTGQVFAELQLADYLYQLCLSLLALHSLTPAVAHRDLKLDNVLISADGLLKLCDFGSCTSRAKVYTTKEEIGIETEVVSKQSTMAYRAPELADLYTHELVNEKVDIWAMGCIFYTLCFFLHPFQDGGILAVINGNYEIPEEMASKFSPYPIAMIKWLLTIDPAKRPDAKTVVQAVAEWKKWLANPSSKFVLPEVMKHKKKRKHKKKKKVSATFEANFDDVDFDAAFDDAPPKKNWPCCKCTFLLPEVKTICDMCQHARCTKCQVDEFGFGANDEEFGDFASATTFEDSFFQEEVETQMSYEEAKNDEDVLKETPEEEKQVQDNDDNEATGNEEEN